MVAFHQPDYVLRRAHISEVPLIRDLRVASLVALEMQRQPLEAVGAIMADVPDVDPEHIRAGRYVVADHRGDLIGGAGWSVLPLQYRGERIVSADGGRAFLSLDAGSVLLRGFFVDADLGRRGVGAQLIAHVTAQAAEAGHSGLEIIVPADAQVYYRGLGFRPVRRLFIRLDEGPPLPILQMRRPIPPRLAVAA